MSSYIVKMDIIWIIIIRTLGLQIWVGVALNTWPRKQT